MARLRQAIKANAKSIDLFRGELQRYEAQQDALLVLLHRLPSKLEYIPPEALGEMFSWTLATVHWGDTIPTELINICLVCKTCRRVVLAIPRLWNHLEVQHFHPRFRPKPPVNYSKIGDGLIRAQQTSKIHAIIGSGHHLKADCPLGNLELKELLTSGPNLQSLTLQCGLAECFHRLVDLMKAAPTPKNPRPWDGLKALGLHMLSWADELDGANAVIADVIPLHIPQVSSFSLRLLSYYAFQLAPPPLSFRPPSFASNLKTLRLICVWPMSAIAGAIESCSDPQILSLEPCTGDDPDETISTHIRLPKVHTLRVEEQCDGYSEESEGGYHVKSLRYFTVPFLVKLELSFMG